MGRNPARVLVVCAMLSGSWQVWAAEPGKAEQVQAWSGEVTAAERDFARTLADRNLQAFAGFIAEDAVFRSGEELLLGRSAVVERWRHYFEATQIPFSWEPDRVTVDDDGVTAVSSGPVRGSDGKVIARFTTVWRKQTDADGTRHWRVIVDQGVPLVECAVPGGEQIGAFNERLVSATRSMDNPATLALWEEDGVSLLPSTEPMVGRAAIGAFLDTVAVQVKGARMTSFDLDCYDIQTYGSWASEWCREHQVLQRADGTQLFEGSGKILLVLHRGADGKWLIEREMWNQGDAPAAAPAAAPAKPGG